MRAFFAIELPGTVKAPLVSIRDRLRRSGAKASWVHPDNMHLTLRFLGDVTQESADQITEILRASLQACAPITLAVRGVGAFPNLKRPSVVWAGLEVLSGDLVTMQSLIEDVSRTIGLPKEEKAFHPHVTLGRIKDSRQLGSLLEDIAAMKDFDGGDFTAVHVSLFSSELTPSGPVYRLLQEFPLA